MWTRSSEAVVAAYQEERDRLLQRRLVLTNEASRRIGSTLDATRTAEELAEVCTEDFADFVTVDLLDSARDEAGDRSPEVSVRRIAQMSVLDGCPESLLVAGQRHSYAEELLGYRPEEALGHPADLILADADTGTGLFAISGRRGQGSELRSGTARSRTAPAASLLPAWF